RYGRPAYGDFPHEAWRRVLARCARRASVRALDYGPTEGLDHLRKPSPAYPALARPARARRAAGRSFNGPKQPFGAAAPGWAARVLVDPGATVVLEEPHYAGARRVFEAAGARLRSVPVDADGLRVEELPRAARLAYVTPSHQFPTGGVLPAPRRLALLAWAER